MHTKITLFLTLLLAINQLLSQNVGIGETNPQGELHVSNPFIFQGITFTGTGLNSLDMSIGDSGFTGSSEINYVVKVSNAGPNPNLFIWSDDNGTTWSPETQMSISNIELSFGVRINFSSVTGHTYDDQWNFSYGPSFYDGLLVVDGDVAIGHTNPQHKLDVNGDINWTGELLRSGIPYVANSSINQLSDGMTENTSIGLGADAGQDNFNTSGTDNTFVGVSAGRRNTAGSKNTYVGTGSGSNQNPGTGLNNTALGAEAGQKLTSGSKNVLIGTLAGSNVTQGSGNVFIGNEVGGGADFSNRLMIDNHNTNTPLVYGDFDLNRVFINRNFSISPLEAFGIRVNVVGPSYGGMYVETNGHINSRPFYGFAINGGEKIAWIEYEGASDDLVVNNSGGNFKVAFNTASKPVAGSWIGNSDARLKKNIQLLRSEEMLSKILEMQGVSYEWNDNSTSFKRPVGIQIGFIAQDLQKVWPEKVSEDHHGYLQTAYGDYDPVIIEAIKALNDKIERQEKEIEVLKRKMSEMETSN